MSAIRNLTYFHDALSSSFKYLAREKNEELITDIQLVCNHLSRASFRVALLAPFNFGKSTLINALLGSELLPSKAVRTTGLAIEIKYGREVETIITLASGQTVRQLGADALKEFAILNRRGSRRLDVSSVELLVPSKFLKNGVELVDLPGTNDSEAQDELVKDELLKSDLVIQVLDANQSFTLDEQEKNKKWLMDRGIKTSIFVINKMNKIESISDRKEILDNVYESVKSVSKCGLKGINSVYRIDALPALKAAKDRAFLELLRSGVVDFRANLQTLIYFQRQDNEYHRMLRINAVSKRIEIVLRNSENMLKSEVKTSESVRISLIEKAKKKESLFRGKLHDRVSLYRNWLSLETLLKMYEQELAGALEKNTFKKWEKERLMPNVLSHAYPIKNVVKEACQEFMQKQPQEMPTSFPGRPNIKYPSHQDTTLWESFSDVFNNGRNRKRLAEKYERDKWTSYKQSARQYLSQFSRDAVTSLEDYEKKSTSAITFKVPPESNSLKHKREMISELNCFIDKLSEIERYIEEYEKKADKLGILERLNVVIILLKNKLFCVFDCLF